MYYCQPKSLRKKTRIQKLTGLIITGEGEKDWLRRQLLEAQSRGVLMYQALKLISESAEDPKEAAAKCIAALDKARDK